MLMMTLPAGIILSFAFATIVAAMMTYFYINHLKEGFNQQSSFQKNYHNSCINTLKKEKKELNNTIKSLIKSNNLLKTKNKILSAKHSRNRKRTLVKNK